MDRLFVFLFVCKVLAMLLVMVLRLEDGDVVLKNFWVTFTLAKFKLKCLSSLLGWGRVRFQFMPMAAKKEVDRVLRREWTQSSVELSANTKAYIALLSRLNGS